MSSYAIGDVHGCSRTLRRLLDLLPFDIGADRLWLVGDLVGHGPDPAGVLRLARGLDIDLAPRVTIVLGNHDLRLLAARDGVTVPAKVRETLREVTAAADGPDLLDWLSRRPILHVDDDSILVHAGLLPWWTVTEARERAIEAQSLLASGCRAEILTALYDGDGSGATLSPVPRRVVETLRVMTTIRTLAEDGSLCEHKGSPETAPPGCRPWFAHPDRVKRGATLVFGHWASLGLRLGDGWVALDSGCAWGGPLSAVRVEDRRIFQTPRAD